MITGQIRALLRRVQERGCFLHATDNALEVSRCKGCESALEIRLRISWPLSERSEPFMPRFRVLGFVAKKRTRGKGGSKNPRTTSKCFRYAVCGESGSRGWYTLRTMDKRFSGAGLGCLWGGTTTPPQRGPQNREPFLGNHCVLFLAKT